MHKLLHEIKCAFNSANNLTANSQAVRNAYFKDKGPSSYIVKKKISFLNQELKSSGQLSTLITRKCPPGLMERMQYDL